MAAICPERSCSNINRGPLLGFQVTSPHRVPVLIFFAITPLSSLNYPPPSKLAAKSEYSCDSNPFNDDGIDATEKLRLIFVWFPVSNLS